MRTSGGLAYGTQTGTETHPSYNDSAAVVTGSWGQDQIVQGTVHTVNQKGGNNANDTYEEIELNARMTITANSIAGYDVDFRASSDGTQYVELGYFSGTPGSVVANGGVSLGQLRNSAAPGLHDGDVIKLTAIGNVITVYQNDVQLIQATDTAHPATGAPGMGHYFQGTTGSPSDFGLTSFTATDNVGAGNSPPPVTPTPTPL